MLLKMFNKENDGSFEIYSLEDSLRNLTCLFYGIAVKPPSEPLFCRIHPCIFYFIMFNSKKKII